MNNMKGIISILAVMLLPVAAFADMWKWCDEHAPKGNVKTVKYYVFNPSLDTLKNFFYPFNFTDSFEYWQVRPSTISYYDKAGRKTRKVYPSDIRSIIDYYYDSLNRLIKTSETAGDIHSYYNDSNASNQQLCKKIKYQRNSGVLLETAAYSYRGDTAIIKVNDYVKSSLPPVSYDTLITNVDTSGVIRKIFKSESGVIQYINTYFYPDGNMAKWDFKEPSTAPSYGEIQQYSYEKYDKKGNWVICKVTSDFDDEPKWWLFVREIEYYE